MNSSKTKKPIIKKPGTLKSWEKKTESFLSELEERGILHDKSFKNSKELALFLFNSEKAYLKKDGKITNLSFYVGIDPTADSLHIGHYMIINLAYITWSHLGLTPIFVIGDFTATIGDPSGKNSERKLLDSKTVSHNARKLKEQITLLAKAAGIPEDDFAIINNKDFYKKQNLIEFFREYGKLFSINNMIKKEAVQNRLKTGISFTEFSYQVFQAIDFFNLYNDKHENGLKTVIQVAGADQWGNILSGIKLIDKKQKSINDPLINEILNSNNKRLTQGITSKLILDHKGNKIGKTGDEVVWLFNDKYSARQFYNYVINLEDETAKKILLSLTSIDVEKIKLIFKKKVEGKKETSKKILQESILDELWEKIIKPLNVGISPWREFDADKKLVWSGTNPTSKLIGKNLEGLLFYSESRPSPGVTNQSIVQPKVEIKPDKDGNISLRDTLIEKGYVRSRREYREFLSSEIIFLEGELVSDENYKIKITELGNTKTKKSWLLISVGKKRRYIIQKKMVNNKSVYLILRA